MSSALKSVLEKIKQQQKTWLVTGAAGFIGSHLVENLLDAGQKVIGLDNFSTGKKSNIDFLKTVAQHSNFTFLSADVTDMSALHKACSGVDIVLHQAALGSVPRSIDDPLSSHLNNVTGTINVLTAARDAKVKRVVYASSSSVYGDEPTLPKKEELIGKPLSPYAATKLIDEIYAATYLNCYGLQSIGLRYFNVFGARQDPDGAYAAVIPKWIATLLQKKDVTIFGDGSISRDFCYVKNVVQANLLAATTDNIKAIGEAFNVAVGDRTTLLELFQILKKQLSRVVPDVAKSQAILAEPRTGDIPHSLADISKIKGLLGYVPEYNLSQGLEESLDWYQKNVL